MTADTPIAGWAVLDPADEQAHQVVAAGTVDSNLAYRSLCGRVEARSGWRLAPLGTARCEGCQEVAAGGLDTD